MILLVTEHKVPQYPSNITGGYKFILSGNANSRRRTCSVTEEPLLICTQVCNPILSGDVRAKFFHLKFNAKSKSIQG